MNILGISAGFHDAAATVINTHGEILFAAHSERYSRKKNDAQFSQGLLDAVNEYGYNHVAYYEVPWRRQLRALYSGEGFTRTWTTRQAIQQCIGRYTGGISSYNHHLSHAAAGFQTSKFKEAAVVVIDAIGETDTISIYRARYNSVGIAEYELLWQQKYPHSIGMFYSAVTKRVGLKPMDEEYITMGMVAYGTNRASRDMFERVVANPHLVMFKDNYHRGLGNDWMASYTDEDIAYAAQSIVEQLIANVMRRARRLTNSNNLVYSGGVALNCLANRRLGEFFENIWIMPNPGDAGSSLGAAALAYGRSLNWTSASLGTNIPGDYPVSGIMDTLLASGVAGVASGRSEFGPRALGNRSLLADPRGKDIKDQVNDIKRRQKFRPFAPVILEELCSDYFDMPDGWHSSPYMQSVARCKHPDLFPAIVHADGTSRVQTVPPGDTGIRRLLEAWYAKTGCPMLLNTSLNIRGEPMVDTRADADRFEQRYGVKVWS